MAIGSLNFRLFKAKMTSFHFKKKITSLDEENKN